MIMGVHAAESLALVEALREAGFAHPVAVRAGTAGLASPSRLACEWVGFRVVIEQVEYYAKVLHADMRPLIDVEQSVAASRAAAQAGVAPAVIMADTVRGAVMYDALEAPHWRHARLDDLARPDRLEALWTLKRQLHRGPSPGFTRSPVDDLQHVRLLCQRDAAPLLEDADWIDKYIDRACAALFRLPREALPLHGDGIASNVMIDAHGTLRLIDFDRAGCMDPWFDVATTLNELFQFEHEWRAGIVAWAGTCSEEDYARCRLYALLDDWIATLSANWASAASVRPLEFTKLAQWTLLRTRMTIRDPRFEDWLHLLEGAR